MNAVMPRGTRSPAWYARIVAIVAAIAAVALLLHTYVELDPMVVRAWLIDLGPIAPLAYITLYAMQVIAAPVPGIPIGAAAGFVFGLVPALIYGSIGLGIGITVALFAGRIWGLRLLSRIAGPDAVARWEQLRLVNSPFTWLLVFLGPSPDLVIFVAGMSRIPLRQLLIVAVLGRGPAMVASTVLGVGALDMGPWLIVGGTVLGILVCFGGAFLRRATPRAAGVSTPVQQPA